MKRLLPLLLLFLVAAIAVFAGMGGDPDDGRAQFDPRQLQMIERHFAEGNLDGARRSLENDPALGEAERLYASGAIALAEQRFDDAVRDGRAAREIAPAAWRPLSVEFAALSALGRSAEASVLAHDAVEAAPDDERVLALAAHHFASTQRDPDPRLALELLDRIDALETLKAPEGDSTAVRPQQLLVVRYMAATATGRHLEALAVANQLEASAPGDPSLAVMVGEAARRAGQNYDAVKAYTRAVKGNPAAVTWRKHLVQLLLDDPLAVEEALHQSFELLTVAQNDREAVVLRARALARAEKVLPTGPDEAVRIYRTLLQDAPDDLQLLRNLAILLYDWKQGGQDGTYLDESYALLRRFKFRGGVIDGQLADVWNKLEVRARERLSPEVIDAVGLAFQANPGDPGLAEAYRSALLTQGKEREAGNAVRKALAAAPGNPAIHLFAARHFLAEGVDQHPDTAIAQITAATKLLGDDETLPESVLWLRVRAYIWAERNEEALDDALRLLAMRPREVPYLEAAGRSALGAGKFAEAEQWLREAKSIASREELDILIERAIKGQAE